MSKARIKDQVLHTRLSREESALFRAFCAENGLTTSEALRRFVRQAAGFGPTYDGEIRDAILEYARQLRAIGVNINQIARILNSGRTPDFPTLQAGIGRLRKELLAQSEDYVSLCAKARKQAKERIGGRHG
ncbi:plasmid mobilization relaxosome protein MobC [Phyllobacterium brassicacearum]|uniref:plasmid mobilization relaxosome protein MobC n=1 Tax=Phyllobacterium brassicacearum TaxID=314235 RepID=UPI0010D99415|nr:plasmid mobilization relaxosome protein MobC [Phyllobacterium brassicacearum]TDQ15329.1 mobilization protein MobC [Phyllobacterium brassicacearum]